MPFLVVVIASFFITTFFGHAIHWALHQRWTGPAFRGHMQHHTKFYPPGDLVSEKYRKVGTFSSGPLLFTPPLIVLTAIAFCLCLLFHVTMWMAVTFIVIVIGYGLFNDAMHDSFHLERFFLLRFKWYRRLRELHFVHHKRMRTNYGIVSFFWDRAFGTFKQHK